MHANAPNPRKQKWHERLQRSGYFFGAILLHLILFLLVATLVIWKAPSEPPTEVFHGVAVKVPPPPPAPPPSSGAAAANPQFEPQPVVVPVATPTHTLTSFNNNLTVDTSKVLDQSLSHLSQAIPQGTGLNAGPGSGLSGNGGGYGTVGSGTGFIGTLYDLKQTPDLKPTDIAESPIELTNSQRQLTYAWQKLPGTQNGLKLLRSFVQTWDMDLLNGKYYQSPNIMTATQICIPTTPSVNAPAAFHVEGTVHARRWIITYHAKVLPPDIGEFRFIGYADDFMVVRIDGRNVLDASNLGEELDQDANVKEDVGMAPATKVPLRCGKWIQLEAGVPFDMQVLIGEGPGGSSGFLLMIQKKGDATTKGRYPVFQLQDTPLPAAWSTYFKGAPKPMVFQVAP